MNLELKENRPHGTKEYPYDQYHMHHIGHRFQVPVHWHEEMEIIYIKQGQLQVTVNGQNFSGESGSIYLVNPRELHLMGSSDVSVDYYTLLFPLELLSFQTMDELETGLMQPLRSGQWMFRHELTDDKAHTFSSLLEAVIEVNRRNHPWKQLRTRVLLLQLLETLIEKNALLRPAAGFQNRMQKEMLAFIQAHYTEKITLGMLSGQFHLSEKYISHYFKEHFHLTFSNYVNHLRLTHAKRLLEFTDLPVTEIALRSGFPSVSYFIRTFKGSCGISPLKYRKSFDAPIH